MPILSGSFPLGETATVRADGRVRKERFLARAFDRAVNLEYETQRLADGARLLAELVRQREAVRAALVAGGPVPPELVSRVRELRARLEPARAMPDVSLIRGHNFDRPLASRGFGSLVLSTTPRELRFRAFLPDVDHQPAYMAETLRMIRGGLIVGVSPGFRLPPAARVPNAERLVPEPGNPGVQIRELADVVLYELSLVSRPAYGSSVVTLDRRSEDHVFGAVLGSVTVEYGPVTPEPDPPPGRSPMTAQEALWL